jgi:hypothetical protein
MKKDFSPEEKLLRLIRGAKKKEPPKEPSEESPKEPLQEAPEKKEDAPRLQPASRPAEYKIPKPQPPISHTYQEEAKKPETTKPISISLPFRLSEVNTRPLNSILIIVLVAFLLYLVYDLFYGAYYKKEETDIFAGIEKKAAVSQVEKEELLDIKPYSFYSSSIEGRNIFMPQQVEIEPVETGPGIEEIKGSLTLIGIIAGDRPQAIIEDKKSRKSHFLYKGDTIGSSKVIDILDDNVVIEYKGQRFNLVL